MHAPPRARRQSQHLSIVVMEGQGKVQLRQQVSATICNNCTLLPVFCAAATLSRVVAPAILPVKGSSMSGHSKWATIKHKKAATDARRGKVFTKIIRELTIAARVGGADPNTNPRLRTAILAGKNENMPNENIERAILRGTGQLEGEQFEEATFEGYGPGGVGLLIQVVPTIRNRIVGEFRHLMQKTDAHMAHAGRA